MRRAKYSLFYICRARFLDQFMNSQVPHSMDIISFVFLKVLYVRLLNQIIPWFTFVNSCVTECRDNSFHCRSNICIPNKNVCNKEIDCLTGEDEARVLCAGFLLKNVFVSFPSFCSIIIRNYIMHTIKLFNRWAKPKCMQELVLPRLCYTW